MANASLVSSLDAVIHLVLCRFGRAGLAYIETDPAEADATTVVQNLLHGRYGWPLRVIALNVDEGWSRDAMAATFVGRRANNAASQGRCLVPWILAYRMTASAPATNRQRR